MSSNRVVQFITGAIGAIVMAYVVIYVFDALSASPLAINPGSPFYPAQLALIETVKIVLPWLVPSVVGVAIVVIAILQDGF